MINSKYDAFSQARGNAVIAYDAGLRSFMLKTYNYMSLGVAFTGLVTLFVATQPQILQAIAVGPMKWVIFAALLGLGWFAGKIIYTKSMGAAHATYWAYCALWGVMMAPMIAYFLQSKDGALDIARAFFITSAMFAGSSIFGYTTKKNLSGMGRFFLMASIGLLVAMVANIFIASSAFSLIISVVTVLLFAGITAYETQSLKAQYDEVQGTDMEARLAIFGALTLYGSFVTMFVHILNILGMMRGQE